MKSYDRLIEYSAFILVENESSFWPIAHVLHAMFKNIEMETIAADLTRTIPEQKAMFFPHL